MLSVLFVFLARAVVLHLRQFRKLFLVLFGDRETSLAGARIITQSTLIILFFVVLIALGLASIQLYCRADHIEMPSVEIENVFVARLVDRLPDFGLDGEVETLFFRIASFLQRADLRVFRRLSRFSWLLVEFEGLDVTLPRLAIATLFLLGIRAIAFGKGLLWGRVSQTWQI